MQRYAWVFTLVLVGLFLNRVPTLAQNSTTWTCPADFKGQTLYVHNWSTYVAPNTISDFETICDVTVVYTEYESDKVILNALRQGDTGYDVVVPDNATVAIMIEEGLLEKLDPAHIPNLKNLSNIFAKISFDPKYEYSAPYQWGTIGIGYRVAVVDKPITSWQDYFTYPGAKTWTDEPEAILGIALVTLGYDANSENPNEIAEARNFLIEHRTNTTIVADSEGQNLLTHGEADMVIEYSGDIFQLIHACNCDDFAFVIPDEGTNIWVDSMVIPIEAANKDLAEAFIDYILDPQVSADISNTTAYATPNQVALDEGLIEPELLENPAIYPNAEKRARMFFIGNISPEVRAMLSHAWDEIGILLGR